MSAPTDANHDTGHASLMDNMYRYQRHIYDVTRKYYLLGRDRTIARLDVPQEGALLEVGCGTGRNLWLAAKYFPSARLYGLDISAQMLESAQKTFVAAKEQPVLRVADATAFTLGDFDREHGFDRIMTSYSLSMIPEWEKAIDRSLAALAPGGSLHIVDFGQQEQLPGWFRALLRGWLARFHVTPRANLRHVLEHAAGSVNARLEFETIARGYAWRAVLTLA